MTFMTWLGLGGAGLYLFCIGWNIVKRVLPAVLVSLFLYDVFAHSGRWFFEALGAAIGIGFVGAAVLIIVVLPVGWALAALLPKKDAAGDPLSPEAVEQLLDDTLAGMTGDAPGGR